MLAPEQIHFFSYATGISLELPLGFTVLSSQSASESYVLYNADDSAGDDAAGDDTVGAFVDVRRVAAINSGQDGDTAARDAVTAAVDAMAMHASERRGHEWLDIDMEHVLREEFRYPNGLPGASGASGAEGEQSSRAAVAELLTGDVVVVFAAVAFGGWLVTISAMAPWAAASTMRATFGTALASMRCITTERA